MQANAALLKDANKVLAQTSRTFIIPISHLGAGLQEAVTAGYLSMRAIDEIEDHEKLPREDKISLLLSIASLLKTDYVEEEFTSLLQPYNKDLPEVSLRLTDWIKLAPTQTKEVICRYTSTMSQGMAEWVSKNWNIQNKEDLDDYTYYVAGLVGVMLSDLWTMYGERDVAKEQSVAFGRGLQLVNIISNRAEDSERGVNFHPPGWNFDEMLAYARQNLEIAEDYTSRIKLDPIYNFCKIPLALAHGTLDAIVAGKSKLNRIAVLKIVSGAVR
ncbi:squalene/phytoene synthase family protein [Paenibacillus crassostreae]|uniref:Phytoene synthase n=1 Tax=Paenibacillus crassostreae TaxID=1763538 RepID=A0A167BSW0_9BACL|nr:squalene/phytoene synthase family protein [Paenibacillus crassostreae]AOZ92461.1 phytoene/squalene synthase family protein [Paenibacillus crassostreae]OAB72409.1 phytoene synthase [Paenibacillus crassostreae]